MEKKKRTDGAMNRLRRFVKRYVGVLERQNIPLSPQQKSSLKHQLRIEPLLDESFDIMGMAAAYSEVLGNEKYTTREAMSEFKSAFRYSHETDFPTNRDALDLYESYQENHCLNT